MAAVEERMILDQAARWRDRLTLRLRKQREDGAAMLAWYLGEQDAPGSPRGRDASQLQAYRTLRENARNTWARLIVDAIAERFAVQGYRSSTGDLEAERRAWAIAQANGIDAEQVGLYTDTLITGRSYALVLPAGTGETRPSITVESPFEVTHEWEPGKRGRVRVALKCFRDPDDFWRAELYTPSWAFAWVRDVASDSSGNELDLFDAGRDVADFWGDDEPIVVENELGSVPVVPFENRATPSVAPLSEFSDLEHVLRRIDELTLHKQVASYFAAFRQKWATGLDVPRNPTTGEPEQPFKAALDRLWVNEDPEGKFGSFDATDLDQYTKAIDAEVAELVAISRVPAHYLLSQNLANPPSAETLVAAEAGLVAKVRTRQGVYGEAWEQVFRYALALDGNPDAAADEASQIVWRDPSIRNPVVLADAATKISTVGVPRQAVWEFLGASPQDVERWKALASEDELRTAAAMLADPTFAAAQAAARASLVAVNAGEA